MYKRTELLALAAEESCFLWGPRQTGKSTLLKVLFPKAMRYDLLRSSEYRRLLRAPGLIREECRERGLNGETQRDPIIIDEVQKIPELLDEVHALIEDEGLRFVLCGSSARKLKRTHANLLGGRAVRYELLPLTTREIPDFALTQALNRGLLPRHYQSAHATRLHAAYVGDYLKEEIAAEGVTRNVPIFSRFLEVAALANGEAVNLANIARECGVSAPTVREYFQILVDTLLGRWVPAYRVRAKRRLVAAPKFYFFDLAPVVHLTHRGRVEQNSELFGRAFEHFIFMELTAHAAYSGLGYGISYWRTTSGFEVDFVLGNHEVAIEVKSTEQAANRHLKGLRAMREELHPKQSILVSQDSHPRQTADGILILPWRVFLDRLWSGEFSGGSPQLTKEGDGDRIAEN